MQVPLRSPERAIVEQRDAAVAACATAISGRLSASKSATERAIGCEPLGLAAMVGKSSNRLAPRRLRLAQDVQAGRSRPQRHDIHALIEIQVSQREIVGFARQRKSGLSRAA